MNGPKEIEGYVPTSGNLPFACRPSWRESKATEENWLVVTIFVSYEMSFPDLNFFRHQT